MESTQEIVITGVGVVSPIGVGNEAFWTSLLQGRSGAKTLSAFDGSDLPPPIGAEVTGFQPSQFVRPRKNLKVMSRDIQLAVAAADMAVTQAGVGPGKVDPERFGVVFGADMIAADLSELVDAYRACIVDGRFQYPLWGTKALAEMFPLWMLKYLPNMPACHIAIAHDARGPNNTHTLGEVSSLTAMAEAADTIRRGQADVIVTGGASSRLHPMIWVRYSARQVSRRWKEPAAACRPFDADRDGLIYGEGSASFVLESRAHAERRGAKVLARLLGVGNTYEPRRRGQPLCGQAIRQAIGAALRTAALEPSGIGYVNAHGLGTTEDDRLEAQAIHQTLPDVPVTAPKSLLGNLGAGGGAVELAASVLGFEHGLAPATLNYQRPDPECPVRVMVGEPFAPARPTVLSLNHTSTGQAIAMVVAAPA